MGHYPIAVASTDNQDPLEIVQLLVAGWCDRRCLKALRAILSGYPLTSPLTDGWGDLLTALQDVRAFARDELTGTERITVENCIRAVERVVHRR
jgi:hypothetical protein